MKTCGRWYVAGCCQGIWCLHDLLCLSCFVLDPVHQHQPCLYTPCFLDLCTATTCMDKPSWTNFIRFRCVSFMLLHWSPIVENFINPPLQSIDLINQAITTTSLHHGRKKTRCVYLHPTDLLRDHNMSLTKTTIRNLKQTSRLHSKTRRKTQNFIVNLLLQMKILLLSV